MRRERRRTTKRWIIARGAESLEKPSRKAERIDVDAPADPSLGQKLELAAPERKKSLQRAPVLALNEDLAALHPGAAREPRRYRRVELAPTGVRRDDGAAPFRGCIQKRHHRSTRLRF